jgi:CRISPR-associated protein Cas5d
MHDMPLTMRVWGEFACFTRPEMKVERVTYPILTPSAARGVLEAIFWKPEFSWRVESIATLKPVRYFSILRNEVNHRQSYRAAQSWAKEGGGYHIDDSRSRAQRHTLALRDVDYLITAQITLRPHSIDDPAKYRDQFRRRVRDGRCYSIPYLGCREFSAEFSPLDGTEQPLDWSEDLGPMLLEIDYASDGSGRGVPRFFNARVEYGVLRIPPFPSTGGGNVAQTAC